MSFKINTDDIKQLESDLKTFKERAYPFATKATVNKAAFSTRERVQARIDRKLITRNKFTRGSIRVEQAKTLRVSAQEAVVGSVAPYMDEQEFGGTKTKAGKVGVPIATTTASGEGRNAQPRRRLARGPNRQKRIKLSKVRIKASRQQSAPIKIHEAAASGQKYIFLSTGRHPGIYKVTGGKRRPKLNLIWDMSKASVSIPRNPIFAPSTRETEKQLPEFYRAALIFQLRRHGLFKDK